MKRCPKCGEEKPLELFTKDKNRRSGRSSYCKKCSATSTSAWYLKNREKVLEKAPERNKRYYRTHREELLRRSAEYQRLNPQKRYPDPQKVRGWFLKRKYGITAENYEEMLAAQGSRCAICFSIFERLDGKTGPHVDHDHATGQVRQLLCPDCNHLLGNAHENPDILFSAVQYLRDHSLLQDVTA